MPASKPFTQSTLKQLTASAAFSVVLAAVMLNFAYTAGEAWTYQPANIVRAAGTTPSRQMLVRASRAEQFVVTEQYATVAAAH